MYVFLFIWKKVYTPFNFKCFRSFLWYLSGQFPAFILVQMEPGLFSYFYILCHIRTSAFPLSMTDCEHLANDAVNRNLCWFILLNHGSLMVSQDPKAEVWYIWEFIHRTIRQLLNRNLPHNEMLLQCDPIWNYANERVNNK